MPGGGVAAAWEITARVPSARVVMLTVSADDRDLFPALRAGACGYLLKDTDPATLADALAGACHGEAPMPAALVGRVLESFRVRDARRREVRPVDGAHLTAREWEVMDLLGQGLGTNQVARRLSVSDATVRSHVASAGRKLGTTHRGAAVAAFTRGSISTP